MKQCTHKDHVGKRLLPLTEFYSNKRTKTGYNSECKRCTKQLHKRYQQSKRGKEKSHESYARRREKVIQQVAEWQKQNKDKVNTTSKRYREQNKEQRRLTTKTWRENNQSLICYLANKRRFKKKKATPSWANEDAMRSMYKQCDLLTKETGIKHHVHHIVPLQELDFVTGLHCEANLKIVTDEEHWYYHSSIEKLMELW